ncbi:NAD-dependent epimerase/dehydratase family protein [Sediminibacterium soli]|uniref:NAD-dependent epimerase/dehydratase family protein n=1 Tax=Sediminibacterium soli TaxID=2698829 RepID=UPI001379AB7F|nr:NAD(P)-dependent oxidoreductase [Sediminibacterium soli]NCI48053.1 NAD(P)-dependent oxidoreductase [Sediminibacterium soli]
MMRFLITGANGFIGTNLFEALRKAGFGIYSAALVDIAEPKIELQSHERWYRTDILDTKAVDAVFAEVKPDIVIHLAAETACLPEMSMDDYVVNTRGSENIFNACEACGVRFLVHTSTQFVNQKDAPLTDTDYAPHTVYGESKVIAEQMLRNNGYHFNWCIIRPTNIWGSWHLRYPYEFWRVLREGKYLHPGNRKVVRSYGYVGNVCWQIIQLIKRREEQHFSKTVFYVGDKPVNMLEWTNDFSLAIVNKPVRIVPSSFVYMLALTGSALRLLRIRFPITLSRYKSMTTDNPAPMDKTFTVLGHPPYTQKEGVQHTAAWLQTFWQNQKKQG